MISETAVMTLATNLGFPGLIFAIWYFDRRDFQKMFQEFQKTTFKILSQYQSDMGEQRRMYENNVELVRNYTSLANDLKDVVIADTAAVQGLRDDVNNNRFCPAMRASKRDA